MFLGTDPDQAPLNQHLGNLAYQSKEDYFLERGRIAGQLSRYAPVTKTASFTVGLYENWIICNGSASLTVTLPNATLSIGREIMLKNLAAFAVVSASSNVKPLTSNTGGTAILPAKIGAWCTLVSDGAHWVIAASGEEIVPPVIPPSFPSFRKNRLIAGNFDTNPFQYGTVRFHNTAANLPVADRWVAVPNVITPNILITRSTGAPTFAESGVEVTNCLSLRVDTAIASLPSNGAYVIRQGIEGNLISDLGFGRAGTRNITISFWHCHSVTGTYSVTLRNAAQNRFYIAAYTQTAANVWQKTSITIPVDTTGTWPLGTDLSVTVLFVIAAAVGLQNTPGVWSATAAIAASGQVNGLAAVNNTFRFALLQLESGSEATAFQQQTYAEVLEDCQRYYEYSGPGTGESRPVMFSGSVTSGQTYFGNVAYRVRKRISPTVVVTPLTNSNFPTGSGASPSIASEDGFVANKVASATGNGLFRDTWTASAEF